MRRGKLLEEIRVDMRKMHAEMRELREEVRDEQRFGNELLRRHELVMTDVLKELRELRAESRAHTKAILALLDRSRGGGAAPAT